MFVYEGKLARHRSLSGNQDPKRPVAMSELKALPPEQQKMWWAKICEETAVAAYLTACKELAALEIQKADMQASIKLQEAKIKTVDTFFESAKLANNKANVEEAKSQIVKACAGLLDVIKNQWIANKNYEKGLGSYQERKYSAARYRWVRNGGVVSIEDMPRTKLVAENTFEPIPENAIYFADLPKEAFLTPMGGGTLTAWIEWFDPKTSAVLEEIYKTGPSQIAWDNSSGRTKSLDPVVAAYIRNNIVKIASSQGMINCWYFSSDFFKKTLYNDKKQAESIIKMLKENKDGLNDTEAAIIEKEKSLNSLFSAITDPLSKAVAKEQGDLYIKAGKLAGAQSAAAMLTREAERQVNDAQKVTKRAGGAASRIGTEEAGSPEDKAARAGTQAAAAFAAAKRAASTARNGAAKEQNDKGRELIREINNTLAENRGATPPVNTEVAGTNADVIDKGIKDNAEKVIETGKELKDSLDKITDPTVDKSGTLTLIAENNEESEKIVGKKAGFPWWLLLVGAAAYSQK